jgi:hypothetical protein
LRRRFTNTFRPEKACDVGLRIRMMRSLSTGESLRRRFTNTNDEECVYYTSFSLLVAPEA